jgi:nucleotide-binding universal stress UspA family protein
MEMRFLLATDMTPASAHMLRYTMELNRHFFARLDILHVFDLPVAAVDEEGMLLRDHDAVKKAAEQELWAFLEENRGTYHFDTTVTAATGGLYRAMAARALEWPADLIIAGQSAQGMSNRWTSTGTGRHLVTHPPVPVLCVPENATIPPVIRNILVCTDLSDFPDPEQLEFLKRFSRGLSANMSLLHVKVSDEIQREEDEKIMEAWKSGLGVPLFTLEHPGKKSLSDQLEEYARAHDLDLMVVFPHKHNWLDRLLLGSETGQLFDQARIPILSMPTDPVNSAMGPKGNQLV